MTTFENVVAKEETAQLYSIVHYIPTLVKDLSNFLIFLQSRQRNILANFCLYWARFFFVQEYCESFNYMQRLIRPVPIAVMFSMNRDMLHNLGKSRVTKGTFSLITFKSGLYVCTI